MRTYLAAALTLFMACGAWAIDFDNDGAATIDDINLLTRAVAVGPASPIFDLNIDGAVDRDDVSVWLQNAGLLNGNRPYEYGDGDLSFSVDTIDFLLWNANKFTENNTDWSSGNYFVDQVIDMFDLGVFERNLAGANYDPPAELPVARLNQARLFYHARTGQLMLRARPNFPVEVIAVAGPELAEMDEFPLTSAGYFGGQHEWFAAPTEPSFIGRAEMGEYTKLTPIDALGPALALSDVIYRIPIQEVLPGDANLDNRVDGEDFIIWNENKFFDDQDKSWQLADFTGDELVNGEDFLVWNENKFTSITDPFPPADGFAVPVPSISPWIYLALAAMFTGRHRSG